MSTFRTAQTSGEVKRGYVRIATAVATKSVPQFTDSIVTEMEVDGEESLERLTPSPPDLGAPITPSETPTSTPLKLPSPRTTSLPGTPVTPAENSEGSVSQPETPRYKPEQEGDELTRPPLPYSTLIAQALQELPGKEATLPMIYNFIEDKYPYYRAKKDKDAWMWRNSIRHNLSLHKAFVRAEDRERETKGKGSYWIIAPGIDVEEVFFKKIILKQEQEARKASALLAKRLAEEAAARDVVTVVPRSQPDTARSVNQESVTEGSSNPGAGIQMPPNPLPVIKVVTESGASLTSSTPEVAPTSASTTASHARKQNLVERKEESLEEFVQMGLGHIPKKKEVNVLSPLDLEEQELQEQRARDLASVPIPQPLLPHKSRSKVQHRVLATNSNATEPQPVSNSKPLKNGGYAVSMDYWNQYDPEEALESGQSVITTELLPVETICLLCGSVGQEQMLHCNR